MPSADLFSKPKALIKNPSWIKLQMTRQGFTCAIPTWQPKARVCKGITAKRMVDIFHSSLVWTLSGGKSRGIGSFRESMKLQLLSIDQPVFWSVSLDHLPLSQFQSSRLNYLWHSIPHRPTKVLPWPCVSQCPHLIPSPPLTSCLILGKSFNLFEPPALLVGL